MIRSPIADKTVSLTVDLPFQIFENRLQPETHRLSTLGWSWPNFPADPASINPRLTLYDEAEDADMYLDSNFDATDDVEILEQDLPLEASSTTLTASDNWTPDSSVNIALTSVVPKSITEHDTSGSSVVFPKTQIFTSSPHRQIIFSVANNFAGLEGISIKDISHFLRKDTNENFYQLFRSSARSYSSRALIQNLFKASIEAGDAKSVDVLLRENHNAIDVNEPFIFVDGHHWTPIERASSFGHEDVVKSLLNYRADVNRAHPDRTEYSHGALDFSLRWKISEKSNDADTGIFRMLLKAGGELSRWGMRYLFERGEKEICDYYISVHVGKNATEWHQKGLFHVAMMYRDEHTSMWIARIMLENDIDLNIDVKGVNHFGDIIDEHSRVIDCAAVGGHSSTVGFLLDAGALLTRNTLPISIASGEKDLVLLLLQRGVDINSIDYFRNIPLAAAIQLGDAQILSLLEDHGALFTLQEPEHFSAAMKAASVVGDSQIIEDLIKFGGTLSPESMGHALAPAIRYGLDKVAKYFIDAGAWVNTESDRYLDGQPLYEAIMRRNQTLVLSLLDADARPVHYLTETVIPFIVLAAEWGNRSVIEGLIRS